MFLDNIVYFPRGVELPRIISENMNLIQEAARTGQQIILEEADQQELRAELERAKAEFDAEHRKGKDSIDETKLWAWLTLGFWVISLVGLGANSLGIFAIGFVFELISYFIMIYKASKAENCRKRLIDSKSKLRGLRNRADSKTKDRIDNALGEIDDALQQYR